MPTYDYECTACGHRFERFQAMSAKPVKKCPTCGKAVRRLLSGGIGVHVKGPGSGEFACGRDTPCHGADSPCAHGKCDLDL